ncbi:MAG: ATP-binding protein [Sedimentisphaerales bacterium]|jgi:two-component system phosphate regulon sensor histidine kinase PhoR
MAKKRLLWQLYLPYLIITILSLVLLSWYASYSFRWFYYDEIAQNLESRTRLAGQQILPAVNQKNFEEVDQVCKLLGQTAGIRLTMILPDGRVVGDSDQQPAKMENHADRPEFRQAMNGRTGRSVRFSDTLGKNMMYIAVPLKEQEQTIAVVRGSLSVIAVDKALNDIYAKIAWGVIGAAVCAAGVTLVVSRKITKPIEQMKDAAKRFATGQLDHRVPVPDSEELAELAGALNETADRLKRTIETITNQKNQLEAILSSMAEGVIAVDSDGRVVSINKKAAMLLEIDVVSATGHSIEEVIRNVDIQRFMRYTLMSSTPTEEDIVMAPASSLRDERGLAIGSADGGAEQPVSLRARGTYLTDHQGNKNGAVIVLSDMTRMQRLENIRRDFVANVSHELRTPITSIKGFVETLLDGAINEPEQAQRFLKIIAGHTDRLMAIIEDLLSLSRLEEDGQKRMIAREHLTVRPVLESAIELSGPKAGDKKIKIEIDCDDDLEALINPTLLEQAVLNLVDNAIKYSPADSTIQISARKDDKEATIAVKDSGCGIEESHLSRLFERFYVVDKARTRKLGGTGLGLAIVKHITNLHGGSVSVESSPGQGSTFTIHLPI